MSSVIKLSVFAAMLFASITSVGFLNRTSPLPFASTDTAQKEITDCIKKYNSKWGENCTQCYSSENTYKVFLRNICTETVDVKCAVQENDKRWKTFTKTKMLPNDTMVAYACNGTGKYLVWVKQTNDKSIIFPSDGEINTSYSK